MQHEASGKLKIVELATRGIMHSKPSIFYAVAQLMDGGPTISLPVTVLSGHTLKTEMKTALR